ncbi:MAG: DUF169 domain-containing protein [Bryobacteraceae bacterium]|jgi:uncharacterized protein (DUF169 family)
MPDYGSIEHKLMQALGGTRRPIAIAFLDAAPEGVERFEGSAPSSCSFWRLAAAGRTFYTVPGDHQNCPIGGYTHNVLQPTRMPDLEAALGLMGGIGYIRMEEVSGVFHLDGSPAAILYAPLGETPVEPSAVIASGSPSRVMLVAEAATRAGEMSKLPLLGRPTCMAIPAAMGAGAVASAGCTGNRVYTEIGDDEMYIMLRGSSLERIAAELETIESANRTLTDYHRDRKVQLSA